MSKQTPCKECVFAVYDGITQTNCKFDLIQRYKNRDINIIEAYDEDKEFYVVDRQCMYQRSRNWPHLKESFDTQKLKIEDEIKIKYQAIVFASDNLEDTRDTVVSLIEQKHKPSHISIIRQVDCKLKPREFVDIVKNCGILWDVRNTIRQDIPNSFMIDFVIDAKHYDYYVVVNAECHIRCDVFSRLNEEINHKFQPISILKPDHNDNGLFVSYMLHKIMQGNQDVGIINKLIEDKMVKEDELKTIGDICPSL